MLHIVAAMVVIVSVAAKVVDFINIKYNYYEEKY